MDLSDDEAMEDVRLGQGKQHTAYACGDAGGSQLAELPVICIAWLLVAVSSCSAVYLWHKLLARTWRYTAAPMVLSVPIKLTLTELRVVRVLTIDGRVLEGRNLCCHRLPGAWQHVRAPAARWSQRQHADADQLHGPGRRRDAGSGAAHSFGRGRVRSMSAAWHLHA